MTRILFLTTFSIFFIGCGDLENNVPTETIIDSTDDLEGEVASLEGSFASVSPYTVSGTTEIFYLSPSDSYSLVMSEFNSSNGPDLRVYLAEGTGLGNSVSLGALSSTNGTLRYDFPSSQFDPLYNYVIIWCEDFSVSFGRSFLSAP